ncbi:hypothetical protein E8E13_005318 [Curvularia kusanoi]|uniref:Uncharacterized protein n=1 Tax=Curvularia kusanoi TaxID=90978 RepID=A0A9P4TGS4_CURKU|nr:hypothetical protein E8E13_005318 [Curvularia kusanoi]
MSARPDLMTQSRSGNADTHGPEYSVEPEYSDEQIVSSAKGSSEHSPSLPSRTFDLAALQKILQGERPTEYAAMRESIPSVFGKWKQCRRLCIGKIGSLEVYASTSGEKNNDRMSFTYGPDNIKFSLTDDSHMKLCQPFRDVTHSGQINCKEEQNRLAAILYFYFLEAGHISGVKMYRNLAVDLVEACESIGAAVLRTKNANEVNNSGKAPKRSSLPAAPSAVRLNQQSPSVSRKRGSSSMIGSDSNLLMNPHKCAKLEDAIAAMQRKHDEQNDNLNMVQQELTKIKSGVEVTAETQRRIADQEQELKAIRDENQALKQSLEQEKLLKLQAETKLNAYIDAQKKISAQFS